MMYDVRQTTVGTVAVPKPTYLSGPLLARTAGLPSHPGLHKTHSLTKVILELAERHKTAPVGRKAGSKFRAPVVV